MTHQVFVIHGGSAFNTYAEYLTALQAKSDITLERLRSIDWKSSLGKKLGSNFDVYLPQMPNKQNAKYLEWKIYFEKLIPLMQPNVILVGHSLGGIFLAKFLSEETFPKPILATLLVAAPFNSPIEHPVADFILPESLERLATQGGKITLYHSQDDTIVPYLNALNYKTALTNATLHTFANQGHFIEESFPELVQDIQRLA